MISAPAAEASATATSATPAAAAATVGEDWRNGENDQGEGEQMQTSH